MKRILFVGLLLMFGYLQYRLWFGQSNGILAMLHFRQKLSAEQTINEKLKTQNNALKSQVQYLHHGSDAIEARARQELGMIKQGEVFYQMKQPTQNSK